MRKWITLLMTLLVGCGSYANANTGQVFFEAGYRHDNISWRDRFPSKDPVATSSIRFKDLDIFQIGLHGRTTVGCNFYARANAYWGWILDGDFERSGHAYFTSGGENFCCDDNFRFGFSDKQKSILDDKYVFGLGAAIGYPFYFCDCTIVLAPVIGYSFDQQNLEVEHKGFGFDEYFGCGCDEDFCCERDYISRWYGPFVGVDFDYRPWNSCVNVWAELEYHWGSFKGKRNFCDDFFFDNRTRHSNDAHGWVFAFGLDYDFSDCWTLGLSVKFQDWEADRHHKHCRNNDEYFWNFDGVCNNRYRTNDKWNSYAINLTIGREF